jgi:hypothetical protein
MHFELQFIGKSPCKIQTDAFYYSLFLPGKKYQNLFAVE